MLRLCVYTSTLYKSKVKFKLNDAYIVEINRRIAS